VRIACCFTGSDAGFLALLPGNRMTIAYIYFSKQQGMELLQAHTSDDNNAEIVLGDVKNSPLLQEQSDTPPVRINGSFSASSLAHLAVMVAQITNERMNMTAHDKRMNGHVLHAAISTDAVHRDGYLGYCDPHGTHTIAVVYSKRAARALIQGLRWLSVRERQSLLDLLNRSSLPVRSDQSNVSFSGNMAGYFNCAAFALKAISRTTHGPLN
jgi:hypothetical protein